jgi:hypothetical protein
MASNGMGGRVKSASGKYFKKSSPQAKVVLTAKATKNNPHREAIARSNNRLSNGGRMVN